MAWLLSPLGRYVALAAGALALISGVYIKGRADCGAKHARQAAKIEAVWSEKVRAADASAYARGLQAANVEARNQEKVDEIGKQASKEPGADDVCLSAATVERLRSIQ